ncbi:hypothetical protein BC332_29038 [Capsicum chinense]|nr:hypothetical protein BC332_29038 [Capsicum chinense]
MTDRKTPTSAVNHRTNPPKSAVNTTTTTKKISKSGQPHKVFTEKDEIQVLKNLSQLPISMKDPLHNFTGKQIAKKQKRLKEKYHKFARTKSLMKTPHDREVYELGRKIWGRDAIKEKEKSHIDDVNLEEFPFLVNEMKVYFPNYEEGLKRLGEKKLKEMNEKWMELKLEESELMVNKSQLFHENLKFVVEGSMGCSRSNVS